MQTTGSLGPGILAQPTADPSALALELPAGVTLVNRPIMSHERYLSISLGHLVYSNADSGRHVTP
jgi:hypothetical protein